MRHSVPESPWLRSGLEVPFYVDLDGTLHRGDLLVDTLLSLVKRRPLHLLACPLWLLRGKAYAKKRVADLAMVDPAALMYNEAVVNLLVAERARGRSVKLASASEERWVRAVATHLGLFEGWIGTVRGANLVGARKAAAIVEDARGPFVYAGDSRADLPVWKAAVEAVVVDATDGVVSAAKRLHPDAVIMGDRRHMAAGLWRALRPHQWVKNILLFVPLFAAQAWSTSAIAGTITGFLAFCLVASGGYVVNDLLDVPSDRHHPVKRKRPLASGDVRPMHGLALGAVALTAGLALGLAVSLALFLLLIGYASFSLAYSFRLKRIALVDAFGLALFYMWRLLAGAVTAEVALSYWLLAFSLFLFLSLALVKRTAEIERVHSEGGDTIYGRGYSAQDLHVLRSMGVSAGYLSVVVLALYIEALPVQELYHRPWLLWLACPLLLFWLSRAWLWVARGKMNEDPIAFALRDPVSRLTWGAMASAWLFSFAF